eukprot:781552-Pleurochrysis_carterae.AAC.1
MCLPVPAPDLEDCSEQRPAGLPVHAKSCGVFTCARSRARACECARVHSCMFCESSRARANL